MHLRTEVCVGCQQVGCIPPFGTVYVCSHTLHSNVYVCSHTVFLHTCACRCSRSRSTRRKPEISCRKSQQRCASIMLRCCCRVVAVLLQFAVLLENAFAAYNSRGVHPIFIFSAHMFGPVLSRTRSKRIVGSVVAVLLQYCCSVVAGK